MKKYDVIVIGTGAGNIILEKALEKGLQCAQIEKGKFGGTCLTRGCIPTKIMVTLADRIREIEESKQIGIKVSTGEIDWDVLTKRVWNKIDESNDLREYYKGQKNLDVYEGEGYFIEEKVLQVKLNNGVLSEPITAEKIFIGVGGRTNIPMIEGLEEAGYITSETFFGDDFPQKPYKSLIIIGGGAIGTEFAHIFSAAGTKVSMVQRNVRLLPKEDEEVSKQILNNMTSYGVNVFLNQEILKVENQSGQKKIILREKLSHEVIEVLGDEILVCPGIISNADSLRLNVSGVLTDEKGWIITDEFLQTNVEGIWAFGDVNGKQQFRHKANYEADIISDNVFDSNNKNLWRKADYSLVPAVTFSYPQVAHIGMTQKQAEEKGYELLIGKHHYSQTAKGYALGYMEGNQEDGFAKLIVDKKTGDMLGMHIIGPEASILIQPFINLLVAGKMNYIPEKLSTIRQTMVPHPTLSEVSIWTYYYMK